MIRNRRCTSEPDAKAIKVSLQQTDTLRWVYIEDPITGRTVKVNLSATEATIQTVSQIPGTAIQKVSLNLA